METSAPALLEVPRQTAGQPVEDEVGDMVIPLGKAVGIKLFSDGVLVVGLSPVETRSGTLSPGRSCGLKEGDVITHIDGNEVDTIEEVQSLVAEREGEPLTIQAVRGEQELQLTAEAVQNREGIYQLGVWLRDSMAGIGTMTFYDPASNLFAALGHGINDVDTAQLMPLESGSHHGGQGAGCEEGDQRRARGAPRAVRSQPRPGHPVRQHQAGDLRSDGGEEPGWDGEPVPVARGEQVTTGAATILSNIRGDEVEEFEIEITHLNAGGDGTRSLMIQVTDPELLEATGGIVQGMSGSPILQNGRLVGAVTHVLVNDPSRGYGNPGGDHAPEGGGRGSEIGEEGPGPAVRGP